MSNKQIHTPAHGVQTYESVSKKIRVWQDVNIEIFRREILPSYQPAVLKGYLKNWPVVEEGVKSPRAVSGYLKQFDNGTPVQAFLGSSSINGRFFYQENMRGFNFERVSLPLSGLLEQLLGLLDAPDPSAIYMGSTSTEACLPGFAGANQLDLVNPNVVPNIWIGNAISISAHFDLSDNIACVVSGKRRFTLFPPGQISNLYAGPLEFSPAGMPISMVDFRNPDFEKFPRFKEALSEAQVAELEPGDALYIPSVWWHHVESLTPFSVLVNFWWREVDYDAMAPMDCLLAAILSLRHLPNAERNRYSITTCFGWTSTHWGTWSRNIEVFWERSLRRCRSRLDITWRRYYRTNSKNSIRIKARVVS